MNGGPEELSSGLPVSSMDPSGIFSILYRIYTSPQNKVIVHCLECGSLKTTCCVLAGSECRIDQVRHSRVKIIAHANHRWGI